MDQHGMITWSELMTTEVEKAKAFYGETLGVSFEGFDAAGEAYTIAMSGGKPAWGIMDMSHRPGGPTGWFTYIAVDDVDARVTQAEAAGAVVHRAPWDIPGVGRIAILEDPTGAMIGWMTPEMG